MQFTFGVSGGKPIGEYLELAERAEAYGFDGMSIFDDLMFKPAWPILFAIAPRTKRMRLGPSVCNPYLIHPAILAENAALLDELTDGRAYLGIGRGAFLDLINVVTPKPITAVREAIELIRRFWRRDPEPFHGEVFQATPGAQLHWTPPRAHIPIMVGTWGERMCAMAGAHADEVKAGSMWSERYGRHMWTQIADGAKAAGRDPARVGLVFGPLTSIADDADSAREHARRTLAFYLPYLAPMPAFAGMEPDVVAWIQAAASRGDMAGATALISDDLLRQFALFGTPGEVIAEIERMADAAPVTRIEFGMPHGPDGSAAALRLLGESVLSHFKRRSTDPSARSGRSSVVGRLSPASRPEPSFFEYETWRVMPEFKDEHDAMIKRWFDFLTEYQAKLFPEWKSMRHFRQVDRDGAPTGVYIMLFEYHSRAAHHAYKERRKDWSGPYAEYKKVDPYQFFELESVAVQYWEPRETERWREFGPPSASDASATNLESTA